MTLSSGTKLGPYEIQSPLGAGGMGEVYRARDTRLDRTVAIKILPAAFSADPERMRRFEQEARAAAALNHPTLMAVYDIGTGDGAPYMVTELLEGETLRECLNDGRMPLRKAIEYGAQIAHGLAAAHDKGIVHRDLKPENIFLTRDGRAKILDFGLAKLVERELTATVPSSSHEAQTMTMPSNDTTPGMVLGTAGYMSPEQVRGLPVDQRSDIFSFGAILYEMLTGERAFKGATPADTMTAILREEPPELAEASDTAKLPPALDPILRHCLQKQPQQRYQSASDLAFNLEALSTTSTASGGVSALRQPAAAVSPIPGVSRKLFFALAGTLGAAVLAAAAFFAGRGIGSGGELPQWKQLTYQEGRINSARFSPDGQTIYCAANFGNGFDLYSGRSDSTGMRPMGIGAFQIFGISPGGGIAFLQSPRQIIGWAWLGTLATVPLGGGAPRAILNDVQSADWAPGGNGFAVARFIPEKHLFRLEYPVGTVLYETPGYLDKVRFSPDGKTIAFLDHPLLGDDQGFVAAVSATGGTPRRLTHSWDSVRTLAWAPAGGEIWFTGAEKGSDSSYAVTLAGAPALRRIATGPGDINIEDAAASGLALFNTSVSRRMMMASTPEHPAERDLSWLGWATFGSFSKDGKQLLMGEEGPASGENYSTFLRNVDGSPPVRLGDGSAIALSPDGRWAVSYLPQSPTQLLLLPTGAGEARQLTHSKVGFVLAGWFPDSKRLVAMSDDGRSYIVDLNGNVAALTPKGIAGIVVTPDSQYVEVRTREGVHELFPIAGGQPRPLPWLNANDAVLRFSADGKDLFLSTEEPGKEGLDLYRAQFSTGRRVLIKHLEPQQPAVSWRIDYDDVSPDGRSYAYSLHQVRSALYLVRGLR